MEGSRDPSRSLRTSQSLEEIRHSLAHLLAAAVLKKFPKAKLGIGPAIETGFYYDFLLPRPITGDDLKELEHTMRELIAQHLPVSGKAIASAAARARFKDQPFKLDLIQEFVKDKKKLTTYSTGDVFTDLCRGGHIKNTREIRADAFKLDRIAGAYWRGDEKNPQLQRIYGLAFRTKEELDAHRVFLEEARKRDHKKLGPELDLFIFSDLVGPGLPLWTPRGTLMRNALDDFVWELRKKYGYQKVEIPHITKKDLYEKSGHWEKFGEELFRVTTREGHFFALKPMNCPHHTQIYARRPWSYKELPQRYSNTTMVYRDEQTGELAGLSRTRGFTQDDAHVFCRTSQIEEEMGNIWNIIEALYGAIGFTLTTRLSFRDPKEPKKFLGTPKVWKQAEDALKNLVKKKDAEATIALGEAAFYGPKIDFLGKDSLGREYQVATIQLDMVQPERFDLSCVNEEGKQERIVMIHAAIMGSIERFLAVVIEHFAGAFPVWLAPEQVRVLPVSQKFEIYAATVVRMLRDVGIRAELGDPNETLGKRIREAEMQKIPYTLILGDREEKSNSVSVRHYRRGQEGELALDVFLENIQKEVRERTL